MPTTQHKPLALIILDGWGYREEQQHNPTQTVATPTFDALYREHPHMLLAASGAAVGLPPGQMGNSEVGHLHIGAGRKVAQDLTRINQAINNKQFFTNKTLLAALQQAKQHHSKVHILGLLSSGGVHSLDAHIAAMIEMIHQNGIKEHYLHAILDGRDTPPRSAKHSISKIEQHYQRLGSGNIASVIGRYYAMDRDKRWDRTAKAYRLLTTGEADHHCNSALAALEYAYQQNQHDEFVAATAIHDPQQPPITINDGDVVIFMNYRADRARQLTEALTEQHFSGFERHNRPQLSDYVTLTEYSKKYSVNVAFPPINLRNTLGEYLAKQGMKQLRLAETEKYAHVTYFMNGGNELAFTGEDRDLVPSPKVATYDLTPEMSAKELTKRLINAINSQQYDVIICNYANPDMVGHTGIESAANKAITAVDECINQVLKALASVGGEALITADHGNIECMFDEENQQPHTAHTNNLVPLFYVGRNAQFNTEKGALDDIAPTVLQLLGCDIPAEMTGQQLLTISEC